MTSCSTEDLSSGAFGALIRIGGLVLSAMIMGIYALVWLTVFKLKATSKSKLYINNIQNIHYFIKTKDLNSATKKLVKALVFIIGFNLVGVFLRIRFVNQSLYSCMILQFPIGVQLCARHCVHHKVQQHHSFPSCNCRLQFECARTLRDQVIPLILFKSLKALIQQ